jgi:hypothetical protein
MKRLALAAVFCFTVLTATARADTWVVFASDAGRVPTDNASLLPIWQGAGTAYGIPWQVLAAINKVETDNGRNLSTSSAGAIGWMQFMPGTWLRWGTDANGDGIADPWSPEDAIYSAARYLAASGGQTDLRRAIYSYNHAGWYVRKVLRIAAQFGNPVGPVDAAVPAAGPSAARVGELRSAVAQARAQAVAASSALAVARATAGRVGDRRQKLVRRSTKLPLFTARLENQRLAALASGNEVEARARLVSAERNATAAQARLDRSRTRFAEAAKARRVAVAAAREARRRQRAARRTEATSWAQQLPWLDGFTGAAASTGGTPRLGGSALRIVSKPAPVIRFTLNS